MKEQCRQNAKIIYFYGGSGRFRGVSGGFGESGGSGGFRVVSGGFQGVLAGGFRVGSGFYRHPYRTAYHRVKSLEYESRSFFRESTEPT